MRAARTLTRTIAFRVNESDKTMKQICMLHKARIPGLDFIVCVAFCRPWKPWEERREAKGC